MYLISKMLKKIYFLISFLLGIFMFSQTLSSRLDKKTVGLGEPNVLTIKVDHLGGKDVRSAPKNELLPFHFEIIKDTLFKKMDTYERTIEFAIFQEGKFSIPALEFNINGKIEKTTPYEIEVVNTASKDDKINDIMKNKEVGLELKDYWQIYKFWVLAAIAIVALAILIFGLVRYGKKPKDSPKELTNQALKELNALKDKKHIEQGNFRDFYVELIDIMRRFLSVQYRIPADVLLTDDLIAYMKQNHSISQENEAVVEKVFLRGDLVKFAKIFPSVEMMNEDWNSCSALVKASLKDIEFEKLRKDV